MKHKIETEDFLKDTHRKLAMENQIREKIDEQGQKWVKVYCGGGEHFKNWLEQCKELGEVMVEEADSTGLKCFERSGEKFFRIWVKMLDKEPDDDSS